MALATTHARQAAAPARAGGAKQPNALGTWMTKHQAMLQDGKLKRAEKECRKLLRWEKKHPVVWGALAMTLSLDGRVKEALDAYERFRVHGGLGYPSIFRNYIATLRKNGHPDEALRRCEEALARYPDDARFLGELGFILSSRDRARALEALEAARTRGRAAAVRLELGNVLFDLGRHEDAQAAYREALDIDPAHRVAYANLLMTSHYLPDKTQSDLFDLHKAWYEHFFRDIRETTGFERTVDAQRPLRLGLLSNGFHAHPVGWMSLGAIRALKRVFKCELYFYYTGKRDASDYIHTGFREVADAWHEVKTWDDERLHAQMLDDRLDILLEMSGHSKSNRLPVVARRAAPVQVKWVGGLFNTSGVRAMDYLITDHVETPEGSDPYYVENLVRLPTGYVAYNPPPYAPEVTPPPMAEQGSVTFGCFNNITKLNPEILALWARLLHRVPNARLLLKYKGMEDPSVQEWITRALGEHGIEKDRLVLEPGSQHRELLEAYSRVDIALDTWPYSGGLTTVEALYMGVPVVSCPGPVFAGRHAASHLVNVGLDDWVVDDFDSYVQLAAAWAESPEKLARLRADLRARVEASPLCNRKQFATDLMFALLIMWQKWIKGDPPAPIDIGAMRGTGGAARNASCAGKATETGTVTETGIATEAGSVADDPSTAQTDAKAGAVAHSSATAPASGVSCPHAAATLRREDLDLMDFDQLRRIAKRLSGSKLFPTTPPPAEELRALDGDPALKVLSDYAWTSFSMEPASIAYLKKVIATFKPRTVLELGSGISTPILSRHHATVVGDPTARYVSVDQNGEHLEATQERVIRAGTRDHVRLIRLDLVDVECFGQATKCYNLDAPHFLEALNGETIDLLIVDGPSAGGPKGIPLCRLPTLPWLQERLSPGAVVCLDDALRETEQIAGTCWRDLPGIELLGVHAVGKGLMVLQTDGGAKRWRNAAAPSPDA